MTESKRIVVFFYENVIEKSIDIAPLLYRKFKYIYFELLIFKSVTYSL